MKTTSKTTPKDFFLHMGAAIALYISAIALMNLAFAIINAIAPDALSGFWDANSIVWPVSTLVVLVPVLYVVEWFIFRDIVKIPEKKDLWVRRWRIYTTLFLTALTMAGDLIVLINVYLNGEITERFVWKVATVFVVSAVIFAYYILSHAGAVVGQAKAWRIALAWVSAVLVFAAVVGGFIIVGSPAKQRSLRFDQQRIEDLSDIQYQVSDYWQTNGKLPASLSALDSDLTEEYVAPVDPETMSPYQYSVEGTSTLQLCATFDLNSNATTDSGALPIYNSPMIPASGLSNNWSHSAGNVCFKRTL